MGSKRNRVRHQAQAATAFSEQRFRPNPITVALLASLGSMPAWAVDTTNINRYVPAGSDPSLNGTSIQTNGTVTTVNTTTVRGSTGFNSFGDFKLVAGDTVNLNLPGGTENLVNLVHNSRAEINGTLNAFKNGSIGGHVIFADPLGVVVGSSGVLNVGSLTITTPSTADMATLHGIATGTGSDKDAAESVEKLKNGGYFSGTGTVEIKDSGKVNAAGSINLFAANAIIGKNAQLEAGTAAAVVFLNTVNVQGLPQGTGVTGGDGTVKIVATNNVQIDGKITALMADTSGASISVAGGSVQLSNGAKLATQGASGKQSGTVKIEGAAITLAGGSSIDTSANGSGKAGAIVVQANSDTSCSFCSADATGTATLPAARPLLTGTQGKATVDIQANAVLDAHGQTADKAGAITVKASAADNQLAGWASANASVNIAGSLTGGAIDITAISVAAINPKWASALLDDTQPETYQSLADSLNSYDRTAFKAELASKPDTAQELLAIQDEVGVSLVKADAKVTVASTANLNASGDLNLRALSTRTVESTVDGRIDGLSAVIPFGLGISYGKLSGETSVEVASGAQLTSLGNLTAQAHSGDILHLSTLAVNSNDGGSVAGLGGIAFGMAQTDLDTHVKIARGAQLNISGDITAQALSEQDLANLVTFKATGKDARGGPAIALALYNSNTYTQFDAALGQNGLSRPHDLNVSALNLIYQQTNSSEIAVGKGEGDYLKSKLTGPTVSLVKDRLGAMSTKLAAIFGKPPGEASTSRKAAAVTITLADHSARATVGDGAAQSLDLSGNLSVQALQYQGGLRNSASSTINSNVREKDTVATAVSAAVNYSDQTQHTQALINDNETVTASHIGVGAKNEIPFNNIGVGRFTLNEWSSLSDVYDSLKTLGTTLSAPGTLPSQYTNATGSADDLSLAGAVSVMLTDMSASAWVGDNTHLTATGSGAWSSELARVQYGNDTVVWKLQPDNWSSTANSNNWGAPISLLAENRVERLSVAGNMGMPFGTSSETGSAVGGGVNYISHTGLALAGIGAKSVVTADGVSVKAKEKDLIVGVTPSAGSGPSLAGNGAVVLSNIDTTVVATISNSATLKADSVSIDARHTLGLWSAAGSLAYSKATGVGAGVAINLLSTDIRATVGDNASWRALAGLSGAGATGSNGHWNVNNLNLVATSEGQSGAYAVSGAVARTENKAQEDASKEGSDGPATAKATSLLSSISDGVSGAWSQLTSYYDKAKSLFKDSPPNTGSPPTYSLALAASTSVNRSRQNTLAHLGDITLDPRDPDAGSKVSVLAVNETSQFSGAGGGALTLAKNNQSSDSSSALAGAVAVNMLGNVTQAQVDNVSLNSNDLLKVAAATAGDQVAMGLGIAVSTAGKDKNVGVAVSSSIGIIDNSTEASVTRSTVIGRDISPGAIQVLAYDRSRALLGGGSFAGASGKGTSVGGALTLAVFTNTINAQWLGSSARGFNTFEVGAYSAAQTLLGSLGVAIAGADGNAAAGSLFSATFDNSIIAVVDGYQPSAGGVLSHSSLTGAAVNVEARSVSERAALDSLFSDNGANALSGIDLGAGDTLGQIDVSAQTSDTPDGTKTTHELGDAKVSGEAILGIAGSVAVGGQSSGGAAIGVIYTASDYLAKLAHTDVALTGNLAVKAYNATETLAVAVGVGASKQSNALVGSSTVVIDRGSVKAQILGTAGDLLNIGAGSLELSAQKAGGYYSLAGAIAASKENALGAAAAISDIDQTVVAQLSYANLTTSGQTSIQAAQQSKIQTAAISGALGGDAAFAGSATFNSIAGTTQALLGNSTVNAYALQVLATQPGLSNSIWALAGNVALSKGSAAGAAYANNELSGSRSAEISASGVNLKGGDLTLASGMDGEIYAIAVGAAVSSGEAAGNVSAVQNIITASDSAKLTNSTVTQTGGGNVTVQANKDKGLQIGALAGALSASKGLSIGASLATNKITANRTASVSGSTLSGFDLMSVTSGGNQTINSLGITGGGAKEAALNAAVTTSILGGTDSATVTGNSNLTGGQLQVGVSGDRTIRSLALAASGAGELALSAANANSLINQTRTANIDHSSLMLSRSLTVDAAGNLTVKSGAVGGGAAGQVAAGASVAVSQLKGKDSATLSNVSATATQGINVLARTGNVNVSTLAGNVQFGGEGAGAGAASVNQIEQVRSALVEDSTLSSAGAPIAVAAQTGGTIETLALTGAGAGTGALAVSVTTNLINATTTAAVDRSSGAADSLSISAKDTSTLNALAGGAAVSGDASVGVATAVNRINNLVQARLDGNRNGVAWTVGDLLIKATSAATINAASISAGASGAVAASAGVASNLLQTSTKALLQGGALVNADRNVGVSAGNVDALSSNAAVVAGSGLVSVSGLVTVNQIESKTEAGISGAATRVNALGNGAALMVGSGTPVHAPDTDAWALAQAFTSAANLADGEEAIHGLAVRASSLQQLGQRSVSAALALSPAGTAVSGLSNTASLAGSTTASIDNAAINQSGVANALQTVSVGASNNAYVFGGLFNAALSMGPVAAAGSADSVIISRDVQARIRHAQVKSAGQTAVSAASNQAVNDLVTSASGGLTGLAASASVMLVKGSTQALVDGNSTLNVGSLKVTAESTSKLSPNVINASLGVLAGGAGVNYVSNQSTVRAWVGDQANGATARTQVNASGATLIDAQSTTKLNSNALSASAGGLGIAGSVNVVMLENTTEAGARWTTFGNSGQRNGSLTISAKDSLDAALNSGAVAAGTLAAGGASASVLVANSATRARLLDSTATVSSLSVDAQRDVNANLVTATAGISLGSTLGGSLGLLLLGSSDAKEAEKDPLDDLDNGGNGTLSLTDKLNQRDNTATTYNTVGTPDADGRSTLVTTTATTDAASLDSAAAQDSVKTRLLATSKQQTLAQVSNSSVNASGAASITAGDALHASNTSGSAVGGFAAFGAGVAFTKSSARISAELLNGSLTAASLNLAAKAATKSGYSNAVNVNAAVGSAGLGIGLGAAVGVAVMNTTVNAMLSGPVNLSGNLTGSASDTQSLDVHALGAVLGVGAAGAVVGVAKHDSSVSLDVADSTEVSARNINLSSLSNGAVSLTGVGAAGGILAGINATVLDAADNSQALLTVGNNSQLRASDNLLLNATASPNIKATSTGISIAYGVSAGATVVNAVAEATARLTLGSGALLKATSATLTSAIARSGDYSADINALGVSGGVGVSVNAVVANARNNSTSALTSTDTTTFVGLNGGAWDLLASSDVRQRANTSGYGGAIYALGASVANATADTTTEALVRGVFRGATSTDAFGVLGIAALSSTDNEARATSGRGGLISGAAAVASTHDNSVTTARLSSTATNADAVSLNATHNSTFNAFVNSVNAALLGASGARALNDINAVTLSELAANSQIRTRKYSQSALTNVSKAASSDYNVESGSGGMLDVAAAMSSSSLSLDTQANVGANVRLNLEGQWKTPQHLTISAYNNVVAQDRVKLDSGGAIAIALAQSMIEVTQGLASVNIGSGADLYSIGNLVLSASGRYDINTNTNAKTYGLAGAAEGESLSKVSADNSVSVGDSSKLFAYGDMKLLAGYDVDNQMNKATLTARTDLWNRTALPIETDPSGEANYQRNNTVTVGKTSVLDSVGDIYAYAGTGYSVLDGIGVGKDLYREVAGAVLGAFGVSVSLDITQHKTVNGGLAKVVLDGTLNSGVYSQQILHITGLSYYLNGNLVNPTTLSATDLKNAEVKAVYSQISDGISTSVRQDDYSQLITARINVLNTQLANYGISPLEKAAFQAELKLLDSTMSKLAASLGSTTVPTDLKIQVIKVDPIQARPGNIYVTGDQLLGSGALRAPGDAKIEIINSTAAFLELSGLEIPDREGGLLKFNGISMLNAQDITTANKDHVQATFSNIVVASNSPLPQITVLNNFNPATAVASGQTIKSPAPDITITQAISNKRGLVDIQTVFGSIYANADIRGKTLKLTAGQDFVLNNLDGFTHIGGDPASLSNGTTLATPLLADGSLAGTVQGQNVVISALYLNINGLIRSGVEDWTLTINDSDIDKVSRPVTGSIAQVVQTDVRSGTVGYSYDFDTQKVILDPLSVGGGYMELSGHILSTGNGQISVLDGYSQVSVVNNSSRKLDIASIDLGQGVEGTLRINDLGRNAQGKTASNAEQLWSTIYTHVGNQVQQYEGLSDAVNTTSQYLVKTTDGRQTQYSTTADRTYVWLTGQDGTVTRTETRYWDVAVGLFKSGSGKVSRDDVSPLTDPVAIAGAEYMGTLQNTGLAVGQVNVNKAEPYDTSAYQETGKYSDDHCITDSFLGCLERRYEDTTTYIKDVKQINRTTVRADAPVPISFIGYDTGKLTLSSFTDVTLKGSVYNENGTVEFNLKNGAALLQGNDSSLIAAKDLIISGGNLGDAGQALRVQVSGDLSAVSSGSINLETLKAQGANGINLQALQATGNITLVAQGAITANNGVVIRGQAISLTAAEIGSNSRALAIDTGSLAQTATLRAVASGTINLTETTGDLWVDQVIAGGDVTLKVANGDLLDGNTSLSYDERKLEQLRDVWSSVGLTGQAANDALLAQQAVLKKAGEARYDEYWRLRGLSMNSTTGEWTTQAFDVAQATIGSAELQRLTSQGLSATQIAAEQKTRTDNYIKMNAEFGGATYNERYSYTLSAAEQGIASSAVWTEEQLRTSITGSLIRRDSGAGVAQEKMNIQGNNVTLQANRIGKLLADDITIDLRDGAAPLSPAQLAALSTAERDDINFDDSTKNDSDPKLFTITQRDDFNVSARGTITATANGDVFLGGDRDYNIYDVRGDSIQIKTDGNIVSALGSNVVLTGNKVLLEARNGSIGSAAQALNTQIGGVLTARAEFVYLTNQGNLTVDRITGSQGLNLRVNGNLSTSHQDGENLLGGVINLSTSGDAGTADAWVNMGNDGGNHVITLDIGGNAWVGGLQGAQSHADALVINTATVGGTLHIDKATDLTQTGNWQLGGLDMVLGHNWNMNAGTQVTATHALVADIGNNAVLADLTGDSIDIQAHSLTAAAPGNLWHASNLMTLLSHLDLGAQARYLTLAANTLNATSSTGAIFANLKGGIQAGNLLSLGQQQLVTLGNLNLSQVHSSAGAVDVSGSGEVGIGSLNAFDTINLNGSGGFTVGASNSGGDWTLEAAHATLGTISTDAKLTALTHGDMTIANGRSGSDLSLSTAVGSGGTIRFGVKADGSVEGVLLPEHLYAANELSVDADGDVIGGNAVAQGQVSLLGRNLDIGRVESLTTDVALQADGALVDGNGNITGLQATAKRDLGIIANRNLNMLAVSHGGAYSLKAGRDLTVGVGQDFGINDAAEAGRDLRFIVAGKVEMKNVTAGRHLSIESGDKIVVSDGVTAGGNITLVSRNSSITVANGIVSTGVPYLDETLNGNIVVRAGGNISASLISAARGDISVTGNSLQIGALTSSRDIDLLARGLISVAGTSASGAKQTWHADDSIFFDRLLAGGQALLDSLTDTRGRVLQADQGAVVNAGWRNGQATEASIVLDEARAPSLSLWSGNLIRVANAGIGQSVDLHGSDIELYGRHTGSGQLGLWVEGSGTQYASRLDTRLDANDILSRRLFVQNATLVSTGTKVNLMDVAGNDNLRLQTRQATVLANNLSPQYLSGADVQLYEMDKAFQLMQNAVTTNTSAYVLHRRTGFQTLQPNFSEAHAELPAEGGVLYQGSSAARATEQQLSSSLTRQRLGNLPRLSLPTTPSTWQATWPAGNAEVRINLDIDSRQATKKEGIDQWEL